MAERFEDMLTGGHPNSLGRTIEVVETVLANPQRFEELFACYQSHDEVVRLRVSNAIKRVEKERHDLLVPYLDRLLTEISQIDQASTQWTLAQLFDRLRGEMDARQHGAALGIATLCGGGGGGGLGLAHCLQLGVEFRALEGGGLGLGTMRGDDKGTRAVGEGLGVHGALGLGVRGGGLGS